MHELLLLRHAEALPTAVGQTDRQRALSPHGEEQARTLGQWLAARGLSPDRVLASRARRTQATATLVLEAFADQPVVTAREAIYDATPGELLALLQRETPTGRTLLVGHNPAIAYLVTILCPEATPHRAMAPATLAHIAFDGAAEPGAGKLLALRDA